MTVQPILAFQYVMRGNIYFYHTDGEELLGPTKVLITKANIPPNTLVTSYLNIIDPDSKQQIFYKTLFTHTFKNKKEFEDGIADVVMDYSVIYDSIVEALPYDKIFDHSPLYYKFVPYPSLSELGGRFESV